MNQNWEKQNKWISVSFENILPFQNLTGNWKSSVEESIICNFPMMS